MKQIFHIQTVGDLRIFVKRLYRLSDSMPLTLKNGMELAFEVELKQTITAKEESQ